VERALDALRTLGSVRASSLYHSEPLGDPAQPWYVNAVAELRTALSPRDLLEALRRLERAAGRPEERARWSPRVLDLDLLLFDAVEIDEPGLVVPHPGLARRRFVLVPLAEIAPEAVDPRSGRSARELLATLDDPLALEKLPHREGLP
jgi:2-amino-4-hydroxy-6-hydroxymethyldihydropteridine diphosphokinase